MTYIKIKTEYITLSQFLKLANLISAGGEAKWFISENNIKVNSVAENRRGRKIVPGDQIEINKQFYTVSEG